MVAYLLRMPAGIPGEVNRAAGGMVAEPIAITPLGTTGHPTVYGVPIVVDQTGGNVGNARIFASGDAVGVLYGLLIRPFPAFSSQDALNVSTTPNEGPVDVLRVGYMTVLLSGSSAAVKGNPVYLWTAAPSGTHILGGFEASNPGGSGFVLPHSVFMGPGDASGNVEIWADFR
jgi:hypothetical protein